MKSHSEYFEANRRLWDEGTEIHLRGSASYPIEDFKKGKYTLGPTELKEVGDVCSKQMLHLQCHFGMDTLSWARLGAQVTGVDLSEKAIAAAKALAHDINTNAEFLCCNVYDLPEHLDRTFDIVYTSYGVLCWLPDLHEWAKVVAHYLKVDGFFYIADSHPIWGGCIKETGGTATLKGDYFATGQAKFSEPGFDYANTNVKGTVPSYEWQHTLSDILNSLIEAGLKIVFFNEYPSFNELGADGIWRQGVPMPYPKKFSLKAVKDTALTNQATKSS